MNVDKLKQFINANRHIGFELKLCKIVNIRQSQQKLLHFRRVVEIIINNNSTFCVLNIDIIVLYFF